MNATQAMIGALAKMRVGGLAQAFGTAPTNSQELDLQVEVYLDAVRGRVPSEDPIPEAIVATANRFLQGLASGVAASKFPSSAEFAGEYKTSRDRLFTARSVMLPGGFYQVLEFPKAMSKDAIDARIAEIEAAHPALPEPERGPRTGVTLGKIIRKFEGESSNSVDIKEQIRELRRGEP